MRAFSNKSTISVAGEPNKETSKEEGDAANHHMQEVEEENGKSPTKVSQKEQSTTKDLPQCVGALDNQSEEEVDIKEGDDSDSRDKT